MTDNGSPPPAPPPSSPLPAVTRADQIAAHDGRRVRLIGRYVEIDVRMAPRPPPRLAGHVAIELADGTRVTLLPVWHRDAPRPADERARCAGRTVEVDGVLHAIAPPEPHRGACPLTPAMIPVYSVNFTS